MNDAAFHRSVGLGPRAGHTVLRFPGAAGSNFAHIRIRVGTIQVRIPNWQCLAGIGKVPSAGPDDFLSALSRRFGAVTAVGDDERGKPRLRLGHIHGVPRVIEVLPGAAIEEGAAANPRDLQSGMRDVARAPASQVPAAQSKPCGPTPYVDTDVV